MQKKIRNRIIVTFIISIAIFIVFNPWLVLFFIVDILFPREPYVHKNTTNIKNGLYIEYYLTSNRDKIAYLTDSSKFRTYILCYDENDWLYYSKDLNDSVILIENKYNMYYWSDSGTRYYQFNINELKRKEFYDKFITVANF